jgi:Xaa-Pro aminopeptidase
MKYQEIESSFFIQNRKKLVNCLEPNSLVLLSSNDEMPETGDQCFPFRQNADFFYLTGIDQEKSILALCPQHPNPQYREVLFLLQTNETIAVWNGYKYTIEHAQFTGKLSFHYGSRTSGITLFQKNSTIISFAYIRSFSSTFYSFAIT